MFQIQNIKSSKGCEPNTVKPRHAFQCVPALLMHGMVKIGLSLVAPVYMDPPLLTWQHSSIFLETCLFIHRDSASVMLLPTCSIRRCSNK